MLDISLLNSLIARSLLLVAGLLARRERDRHTHIEVVDRDIEIMFMRV